ncbi:hypothetical protein [Adhaeribacter aquaticus]|uniref:hypothetical protein n=1 Tax=Adhaeribacter aquaticus TaxID=299567 RepID=UPI00041D127D|nr:hypothetical protein [Adhaeribacter aquaticus]
MPKITINTNSFLDRKNTIANYSFSDCLGLLVKLQQLDSQELQSNANKQLIESLEERIKYLAHNKMAERPVSFAAHQAV